MPFFLSAFEASSPVGWAKRSVPTNQKEKAPAGAFSCLLYLLSPASELVGEAHARVGHRVAAGLDAAGEAPRERRVGVHGDDEVVPEAGAVQISVQFAGMAAAHRDLPRRGRLGTEGRTGEEVGFGKPKPGAPKTGMGAGPMAKPGATPKPAG